nr:hypothetical protein [Tanacetum cinerariifolium]
MKIRGVYGLFGSLSPMRSADLRVERIIKYSHDKENPLGKDRTGKDVDPHLYRSMIGSLMYLTASRPDIMFAVCACARHQVTPKECHLHAVKRIFRYLKGHPKLGLWYPKESPFDLVAYSDSDYGGATQDHKSTTGGCQFLGRSLRLIPLVSKGDATMTASCKTCWSSSPLRHCERFHTAKTFDLVWIWLGGDYRNVFMCINFLHGSDSEQRTHEFIHVYLASASVYVWIGQYTMRTRNAQSLVLPPVADEPASPLRDFSQGEACPTDSGFRADQDRANIAKTSTLPHDSVPRVTSPATDEGSMQLTLNELTALCTSLQRQHSKMVAKFKAQDLEIHMLKARVKLLEDREGVVAERSGDDAPIKGRNLDEGEAVAVRVSDDTEEMATVLTSMDTTTVLASGVAEVPTGSGSIPTDGPPAVEVPTGSDVVPTAESETPKKKKVQEQIDAKVARELEKQMVREDQRMSKQIARDAEIARIHAEEELQIMINGLDRSNETVAKYLQEYHQFASELPLERRIELISDLVRGMTFEEIEAKFTTVWKQIENFIPMGSKEEAGRFKRKGIRFKQESVKKLKTSKEVPEEVKTPDEVPEEKVKEMMQLVPIEELYDSCGVHHVTSKDNEIFMLIEKDYPLRKGLAIMMICYKLKVENYSHMASDLILKIHKIASSPRQIVGNKMHKAFPLPVIEFPLPEEVPTAIEE